MQPQYTGRGEVPPYKCDVPEDRATFPQRGRILTEGPHRSRDGGVMSGTSLLQAASTRSWHQTSRLSIPLGDPRIQCPTTLLLLSRTVTLPDGLPSKHLSLLLALEVAHLPAWLPLHAGSIGH